MRSFAVIATFLLVAQAQAFDAKETIQCIQNHMQTALNNSFDDIGDRFDKIDGHRQELTKSLRNELEKIRDTFQENLEKRMQEIDTNCDEEEGMINKAKCALRCRVQIILAASSEATAALKSASKAIYGHTKDFGGKGMDSMKNLGQMIMDGLPKLMQAARECF
ncbi:uncharacterized protein LOC100906950 [Galendromus occidentalis]|uniref:Uncharacterized protein LOC100906950 n=1 Tax=Galendromus occidentalis TaxID=34638 RepID=A0AAJ6QVM8_9ACAR|nr:uncharacterized protein LOC100906950 [Galendromus occidentalis]